MRVEVPLHCVSDQVFVNKGLNSKGSIPQLAAVLALKGGKGRRKGEERGKGDERGKRMGRRGAQRVLALCFKSLPLRACIAKVGCGCSPEEKRGRVRKEGRGRGEGVKKERGRGRGDTKKRRWKKKGENKAASFMHLCVTC